MAVSKTRSNSAEHQQGDKGSSAAHPVSKDGTESAATAPTASTTPPSGKKNSSGSEKRKRGPKIDFRVTPTELAQIKAAADRAGLTVGSYVRSCSLKAPATRSVRRAPVATAQLAQLLGLLGAARGDIQRLAQLAAAGEAKHDGQIDAALADLREAATAILRALGKRP